jgi:hypothetical protein
MIIGEVEEFLWSLSTCLEGQIGDWYLRFGGSLVSVRVDSITDQITISAPVTAASPTAGRDGRVEPAGRVAVSAPLSTLTVNELQAAFQRVVDHAQRGVRTGRPAP